MIGPSTSGPARFSAGTLLEEFLTMVGVLIAGVVLTVLVAEWLSSSTLSGYYPYAWSYSGNGGLEAFILFPLVLVTAVGMLALWVRGYSYGAGVAAALIALPPGVAALVTHALPIVQAMAGSSQFRLIYGTLTTVSLTLIALAVGFVLAMRLARRSRRMIVASLAVAALAIAVGIRDPITDTWPGSSYTFADSVLIMLTATAPLLAAGPKRRVTEQSSKPKPPTRRTYLRNGHSDIHVCRTGLQTGSADLDPLRPPELGVFAPSPGTGGCYSQRRVTARRLISW